MAVHRARGGTKPWVWYQSSGKVHRRNPDRPDSTLCGHLIQLQWLQSTEEQEPVCRKCVKLSSQT